MNDQMPARPSPPIAIAFAGVFLAATLTACTAAAFGKPSLAIEVQSAVSSGSVSVRLVDKTAVLTGRVTSVYDSNAAVRAAARYEGVEHVINRIIVVW
ncbi:BON domain-containing protein [Granulosicoccus sp. 3-233]|uniref:BON domain-containing protein n=1 Tax=Granulosicoccus sp. 3-233 TaxID=3417969 RepID=UPI003D356E80